MDHSGRNVDNGTVHGGGGGKWEISVTAAQFLSWEVSLALMRIQVQP